MLPFFWNFSHSSTVLIRYTNSSFSQPVSLAAIATFDVLLAPISALCTTIQDKQECALALIRQIEIILVFLQSAGEETIPSQLPAQARVTTSKISFELWRSIDTVALGVGGGFKASKQDLLLNSSRVLINHRFKAFNCTSWSRPVKNSSKMLVNHLFASFNRSSRSRSAESTSAELVDPSSMVVPGVDPWKAQAQCSLILNNCDYNGISPGANISSSHSRQSRRSCIVAAEANEEEEAASAESAEDGWG
nr:hypothetical protein Iba_scaffold14897CG0880 [Ipomoea batatas]